MLFILSGCSSLPQTATDSSLSYDLYRERLDALSSLGEWSLKGRLAVSDEKDGGSGTLRWRQSAGSDRLDFHGALGRGAWTLESDDRGARLQLADGRNYTDRNLEDLVNRQLGWQVPVDALSWWVRGLEAPGGVEKRSVGQGGELNQLEQFGWVIEFSRWRDQAGTLLPLKMVARQEGKSVKLAVREWNLDPVNTKD